MPELELDPHSRSHRLREMFWRGEQDCHRESDVITGSDASGLVGKARDFEILLQATPAAMQPVDLLVGVSLVVPAEGSSIDRGEYDGHYTPGNANILQPFHWQT